MEGRPTKCVLVIGTQGVLGGLMVGAFEDAGWDVRSAARRPRPGQVRVDLDQRESIEAAAREDELIVNTVPHPNRLAERHVLEYGGTLINVSAAPAAAARSLRAVAGAARGIVVMNAGLAPGVTTIVAADLLRRHPDADRLEIVYTLSSTTPRGPASADFVRRGLTTVARHPTAVIPLEEPFGERVCVGFDESDAGWLGGIAEGRTVRQYVCFAEPAVHERLLELNGAGRVNELPRSLIGPRSPADARKNDEPVAHWVAAISAGRRLGARSVVCRGDFLHAARSTVVLADALLTQGPRRGCFDAEEIWTLSHVEAGLRAAGIKILSRSCRAT